MEDTDPESYVMLAQVMNSLLPEFRVALESTCINSLADYFKWKIRQDPWLKTTQCKKTKQHGILNLKFCDMSQTSSFTLKFHFWLMPSKRWFVAILRV